MSSFLAGLGIMVLGFGFLQFSNLFGVYSAAPKEEDGTPWTFLILKTIGFALMVIGLIVAIIGIT